MSDAPMTARDVAAALDVHLATVHRMVADGRLAPTIEFPGYNGARLFDRASVEAMRQEHTDA